MKKQVVVHPLLFSLYPIILLYSTNFGLVEFPDVIGTALATVCLSVLFWWVVTHFISDYKRAGLIVTAVIIVIFSFEAFCQQLLKEFQGNFLGDLAVIIFWALLAVGIVFVLSARHLTNQLTYSMNILGTLLCCILLMIPAAQRYRTAQARALLPDRQVWDADAHVAPQNVDQRDIYYVVLDGYGRADVLQQEYGFQSPGLVEFLERRGFVVAKKSMANYPFTVVSMASSLNFSYLQDMVGDRLSSHQDYRFIRELLRDSRVLRFLRSAGYSVVTVHGTNRSLNLGDRDVEIGGWWQPSIFGTRVWGMTPFPWLMRKAGWPIFYDLHRMRILEAFEKLSEAADLPGPKFVYSHIFVGHPPFVFGPKGEEVNWDTGYGWHDGDSLMDAAGASRQQYVTAYRDQVKYLNGKIKAAVDSILERSSVPPVMIIQGDHGPGSRLSVKSLDGTNVKERFSILNAYHLPGAESELLYDTISPVNTFRIVLNEYFGTSYPILEDKSYYCPFARPYDFVPVEPEGPVGGFN